MLAHPLEHPVVLYRDLGAEASALGGEGHVGLAVRFEELVDLADLALSIGPENPETSIFFSVNVNFMV